MSYFLTTQTGFSAVPLDCLQEIFQYLENDMTSLYQCILVNRTWCRISIALLWRRPFEYSGSESTRRYSELIRTYITCLSSIAKREIYSEGYDIPDSPRQLFPYHEYLKELDCQKLDEAVEEWIVKFGGNRPKYSEDVVYTELLRLLLSRGKGLWRLRLGQYRDNYNLPPISSFPRIKCTLANLRRFEFRGELDIKVVDDKVVDNTCEFLRKLSSISNNLEYIDVDINDMTKEVASMSGEALQKLIASQKNLSFFRYNQENSNVDNSKDFVKALSHNANTLKNIEFIAIPLNEQCLGPLKNLNNLECIQFAYCHEREISIETEEIVDKFPSQLKVEKLIFHRGTLNSVTLEVLRLVNTSLRELTVDNLVLNLFDCIFEYCPNITYLATVISPKNIESLSCLSANKIEHLILKTLEKKDPIYNEDIETKDFQQLGKSLSLSLRHLSLNFNLSAKELSSLLKECQSPLESLCLKFNITADDDLNKDDYLKAVMEFAEKVESFKEFKFFLNFEGEDNIDIFSKDLLAKARLRIPNISRETRDPFAYVDLNSKVSSLL